MLRPKVSQENVPTTLYHHNYITKIIDQGGSMLHVIYTKQLNVEAEIETRQHFSNFSEPV